jgi:hypothetical protein
MIQAHDVERPSVWQQIFLKSKVNGARYQEQPSSCAWLWPQDTYLQRRLGHVRMYRSPDEVRELEEPLQRKTLEDRWDRGPGSAGSLEKPICIDMPSDDWSWVANP